MKLIISAIGKLKNGPEKDLVDDYAKRLTRWKLELFEHEVKQPNPKDLEGTKLIAPIPMNSLIIALDEDGKQFTSREFASMLQHYEEQSVGAISFLIGGADGHSDMIKNMAAFRLSLGKLTLPHLMARAVLMEQIYRAQQILQGHPYHRD